MAKDREQERNDRGIPAGGGKREAQDREKGTAGHGGAESPVDSMHVDAPTQQDNARGHRAVRESENG